MAILEFWKAWKEERRLTVECNKCGKEFNAKKQVGLCPHVSVEQFIYEKDSVRLLIKMLREDKVNPFNSDLDMLMVEISNARIRNGRQRIVQIPDFPKE